MYKIFIFVTNIIVEYIVQTTTDCSEFNTQSHYYNVVHKKTIIIFTLKRCFKIKCKWIMHFFSTPLDLATAQ